MRTASLVLLGYGLALSALCPWSCSAQNAPSAAEAGSSAPATASSLLSPALTQLQTTLSGLRLDKWKAPGPVRQETSGNIGSIQRDLAGTLPALLAAADAAPGVLSKNLPVFRNVDAVYDVLLRIVETADLSAPEAETDTLHHALGSLDDARRSLGDALQTAAVAQESTLARQSAQLAAAAAVPARGSVVDDNKPAPARRKKGSAANTKPQP